MKTENQLLSRIAKALNMGGAEAEAAVVESTVEAVTVDNEALLAAQTELAAKTDEAMALAAQVAELTAKLDEVQAIVAAVEAEKAEMLAKAAEAKLAARKAQVVAAIGTEKADALLAATENLDDAAFAAVVSAMAGSVEAEATTSLFVEQGVAADADASKVTEASLEMQLLKSKYGAN